MQKLTRLNKILYLSAIFAIVLIFACLGIAFAKYTKKETDNVPVQSTNFVFICTDENGNYFEDGKTYQTYSSVKITLSNNEASVTTLQDINYSVTVEGEENPTISPKSSGKLTGNTKSSQTIEISNLTVNETYTVTISTSSPYVKAITFTLKVREESALAYYQIVDNDTWVQLDIYTGNTVPESGLTINYGVLSPDNTNDFMKDWQVGTEDNGVIDSGSGIISKETLMPYAHYTLYFFKNGKDVTINKTDDNKSVLNGTIYLIKSSTGGQQ